MSKDLKYYKENCVEELRDTPISVLRYISELEKATDLKQGQILVPDNIKIYNSMGSGDGLSIKIGEGEMLTSQSGKRRIYDVFKDDEIKCHLVKVEELKQDHLYCWSDNHFGIEKNKPMIECYVKYLGDNLFFRGNKNTCEVLELKHSTFYQVVPIKD